MVKIIRVFLLLPTIFGLFSIPIMGQQGVPFSQRMAESIMQRHPDYYGYWNYETGTVLRGFEEIWKYSGETTYYDYLQSTVDLVVQGDGTIQGFDKFEYNLDEVKEGSAILVVYDQTGEQRYRTAVDSVRSQLKTHPRNSEGGFYHKLIYPTEMWLDGLYMAEPFYCAYGVMVDDMTIYDDVALQLKLMEHHARDENTGLLYHGWDEDHSAYWADPVTGCSPVFWGRAMGWYAMALVDVLDFYPETHEERDSILLIFQRLASAIRDFQDPESYVWWQVVDSIDGNGNWKESSVSCMFVYALAKGVRMEYIDPSYLEVVKTGYGGVINEFITYNTNGTINLISTCEGTGVGGSYNFYINRGRRTNDPKGVGPFVLASVEMEMAGLLVPPGRLATDSVHSDAVYISWDDNSETEDGYIIERNDGWGFAFLATTEANTINYSDPTVVPETTYEYRLQAYNDEDTSIYSKVLTVEIPPEIPDYIAKAKTGNICFFPIPANDILYIKFGFEPVAETKIEIYDMQGNLVITEKACNVIMKLDSGDLTEGVYSIRITNGASKTLYTGIFVKRN